MEAELRELCERLRALLEKATPRPWTWSENGNILGHMPDGYDETREVAAVYTNDEATGAPNAPLVIEAANALPRLLDTIAAQAAELEGLRNAPRVAVTACNQIEGPATLTTATCSRPLLRCGLERSSQSSPSTTPHSRTATQGWVMEWSELGGPDYCQHLWLGPTTAGTIHCAWCGKIARAPILCVSDYTTPTEDGDA